MDGGAGSDGRGDGRVIGAWVWPVALAVVCASVLVSSCKTPPQPRQRLVVGITDRPFSGIVAIADEQGYFAKNGLTVELRKMSDSAARIGALTSGTIDVAHAPDFAFASASFENTTFRVICQTSHAVDHQVAFRKDSGISTPADLAGKRIGVRKGSQFEFVLQRILANAGMSEKDVTIVDVSTNDAPVALAEGKVDAIITFSPLRKDAGKVLAGKAVFWSLADSGVETWSLLAVSSKTARERVAALDAFALSLVQAQKWAEENPDAALAIVRSWSGEPGAYPDGWPADQLFVALSEQLEVRLDEEISWIARTSGRPVPGDATELFDPGPLRAADPALVTVTER